MLTVQQAVLTVESLISKVQQQKQLIHQLIQENEHLRQENKQLRKENEQLKYRVQELEARTKKNSSNSHCPHLLTVLRKSVPPASRLAKSLADRRDMRERRSVKWNIHIIVSSIAYIRVKDAGLLCVT
ncbi:transposase domain protein [Geobacillus kaustophilus]|uniref:Transposase domain protein n=1 Tax=Geobacillus kaustophilus TaxID=1462 RepID=A0A0D8BRR9_GEOKU|nr:transposase domain protein [Geobacillus kaustophilus]KJE28101.1 transposase domain protein [Geobacillus kaustophilus]